MACSQPVCDAVWRRVRVPFPCGSFAVPTSLDGTQCGSLPLVNLGVLDVCAQRPSPVYSSLSPWWSRPQYPKTCRGYQSCSMSAEATHAMVRASNWAEMSKTGAIFPIPRSPIAHILKHNWPGSVLRVYNEARPSKQTLAADEDKPPTPCFLSGALNMVLLGAPPSHLKIPCRFPPLPALSRHSGTERQAP
jgi:hypothetical protein